MRLASAPLAGGEAVKPRTWNATALLEVMRAPEMEASERFVTWAWRYFLAHLAFRYLMVPAQGDHNIVFWGACIAGMVAAFALSFTRAGLGLGNKVFVFGLASVEMTYAFPFNSNHSCLEYLLILAFIFVDFSSAAQREFLVATGRWLIALVMLHSGIKKVLHGTYFNGTYLATEVGNDRMGWALRTFIDSDELARLQAALDAGSDGPYMLRGALALVVSNAVYVTEILAGLLLIDRQTRLLGAVISIAVLLGIEVVARELTFGLLALNLLMLFFPSKWRLRAALLSIAAYVSLAVAQFAEGPGKALFI